MWKAFIPIRVLIDITQPLKRKMKMKKDGRGLGGFKNERLSMFSFCGVLLGIRNVYVISYSR